jgi:hypothetical protein
MPSRARVVALSVVVMLLASSGAAHAFVTGAYGHDSSDSGYRIKRRVGFNTVYQGVTLGPGGIAGALHRLDRLDARGMKAVVWLGSFDRDVPCGFERDDAWIEQAVAGIAGHPAIAAYQLGDEVNGRRTADCVDVPGLIEARSELVRSLDPDAKTYVTLGVYGEDGNFAYEDFVGRADILGLVVYPCVRSKSTCVWDRVRNVIREAKRDGIPRYWAVVQDFGNASYRQPTPDELQHQMRLWRDSDIRGYFVYHWQLGHLEDKRGHLRVLERSNRYFRHRART